MVLRDVIAVETRVIGRGDELQPLVKLLRQRTIGAVNVIKESKLQSARILTGRPVSASFGPDLFSLPL